MLKVMLAEDDVTMLSLLKTLLKMEGFQPIPLDSGDDIVEQVLRQKPDVLLMDVHLNNKNGIEELSRLRSGADGNAVRVVMTSGLDFKDKCLASGANVFIQKPFMPDDLIASLRGKN